MKELEDGCSCRMETPKLLDRLVVVITGTIPAPNTETKTLVYPGSCQLEKVHNLKVENYVLFGRLSEDFKPGR